MNISIEEFLQQDEKKDLLRLLTAGSVDDGKSTLIGRCLHDSKKLYEDQLDALIRDSKRIGNTTDEIDYSLLLDGLKAEREQGITIDVAYRYFSTNRRKFIIADTPGHEQYTRNMITGGSTADLAIILVDARNGIVTQTKRHTYLVALLGIKHILLAVNKMDAVGYNKDIYDNILAEYMQFTATLNVRNIVSIPLSALKGDNVVDKSLNMEWYDGETLMQHIETVVIEKSCNESDFRFPVQYVMRPNQNFRGFSGKIASGTVSRGDELIALPSGKRSHVESIVTYEGKLESAFAPQSVTITLTDEIDISRGEMLVHPHSIPHTSQHIDTMIVWMDESPMSPNKKYFLKQTTNTTRATIKKINHLVDVNTTEHYASDTLSLNQIGRVSISCARDIFFDTYTQNKTTGAFILIDPITHNTCAVGMIIGSGAKNNDTSASVIIDLQSLNINASHFHAIEIVIDKIREQGIDIKLKEGSEN